MRRDRGSSTRCPSVRWGNLHRAPTCLQKGTAASLGGEALGMIYPLLEVFLYRRLLVRKPVISRTV